MKVTINSSKGALVLFDFTAAFPSVSHEYMWAALAAMHVPPPIIRAFKHLYTKSDQDPNAWRHVEQYHSDLGSSTGLSPVPASLSAGY